MKNITNNIFLAARKILRRRTPLERVQAATREFEELIKNEPIEKKIEYWGLFLGAPK